MTILRIAAVVDKPDKLELDVRGVLEEICADDRFDLSALYALDSTQNVRSAVFDVAMRCERALFARSRSMLTPRLEAFLKSWSAENTSTRTVTAQPFDVVLDFTRSGLTANFAEQAQFGVWRLSCADPGFGFFEALRNSPTTETVLWRRNAVDGSPRVIARAAYNTKFIASRNGSFVREKARQLLLRELKRLVIEPAPADLGAYRDAQPPVPNVNELMRYGVHLGMSFADRALEFAKEKVGLRPGMFYLRIGEGGPLDFDPAGGFDVAPRGNELWADPFFVRHNDETYVFFEDYEYSTGIGKISVGRLRGDRVEFLGPALETPYHLSFPFIFKHDGEYFMAPETHQTKRLEIWRCTDFPHRWTLHATALEGVTTVDSAICHHQGGWWLFTNITNDLFSDHNSELHLFRLDGPQCNKLIPHPLNPVVIDARTARGGGRIINTGGRLLRLSQDNSHGVYGYGLNVMEIMRLDMLGYEETLLRRIAPDFAPGLIGCHHADFIDGRYVIDVRKKNGGWARGRSRPSSG